MLFARLRLSTQLLILTLGTALLAIILLVALAVFLTTTVVQQESDQRLTALTQATSDLITPPLVAHDTLASSGFSPQWYAKRDSTVPSSLL